MTFSTLKTHLKALPCGKKLNHSVYIVEESLQIVNKQLYKLIADLKTRVEAGSEYNIIKFFTNEFKVSWLSYPDFFTDPHPGQCFLANLSRRKINWESISFKFYPDRAERKRIVEDLFMFLGGGR